MRTQKRLLVTLAAFAAAGLVGCLNSPDSAPSISVPVTEAEIQAALAGDSLHPAPPPRPIVCDTLKVRLEGLDTSSAEFKALAPRVLRACAVRPDSLRPEKPAKPDSLRPAAPKPPKPDSLRPVPPVKPDSGRAADSTLRPLPPKPPKPPKK